MQPSTTRPLSRQSLAQIEYEARRLRAETLAQAGAALRRSVVRLFGRRPSLAPTAEA